MRSGTPGFVGARLREAREARELTAISLADLLGVSRQAVSQYEKGLQSPAPEVMKRISTVLNLPIHYFLRPVLPEDENALFYRSMNTATKSSRARAERRYGWVREIVGYVRQYTKLPAVNFPDFSLPSDPSSISDQQIEETAAALRAAWGLGDGPISNVMWLVENNGAIMSRYELGADELDAFSQWCTSEGVPYFILGADKNCAARSRYDVGHELGHMVLHRKVRRTQLNQKAAFALIERQANRFAGAFLLPERSFSEDFFGPTLDSLRALKARWKVSIAFMIKRAGQIGLILADQERRLWMGLSRRGWKYAEPLDDTLPPEEPRLLRRSLELLIKSGVVARHDIPFHLALGTGDIESLTGLPRGYLDEAAPRVELLQSAEQARPGGQDWGQDRPTLPFPKAR